MVKIHQASEAEMLAGWGKTEAVHPETVAYAREQGVRIWADSVLIDERP